MKKCDHSAIKAVDTDDNDRPVSVLKCQNCGKTWRWNTLLRYFSDSFVGVFEKKDIVDLAEER